MKPMKILHILGGFYLPANPDQESMSGVVRAALEIAKAQVALGHSVTVANVGNANDVAWQADWQGVRLRSLAEASWARFSFAGRSLDFRRHWPYMLLTRQGRFDVVHGHIYNYLRFLPAQVRVSHFHSDPLHRGIAAAATVPATIAAGTSSADSSSPPATAKPPSGGRTGLSTADFTSLAQHSDLHIAVSDFVARQLEQGFRQAKQQSNIQRVYNGVALEPYQRRDLEQLRQEQRRAWGYPDDAVVLVYAGAIVPEKGVLALAQAFARCSADNPRLRLVLAGSSQLWVKQQASPDYQSQVEACLQEAQARQQVRFLGKVASGDMPAVYAAGDALVMPSLWQEPFGLVILEAFAAGLPVIASQVGGIPEVAAVGAHQLVAPGDVTALAQAITTLGHNPSRPNAASRAALQQRLQEHFSWTSTAQSLCQHYQHSLQAKQASQPSAAPEEVAKP